MQRVMSAAMLAKVHFRTFGAQSLADMARQPAIRYVADEIHEQIPVAGVVEAQHALLLAVELSQPREKIGAQGVACEDTAWMLAELRQHRFTHERGTGRIVVIRTLAVELATIVSNERNRYQIAVDEISELSVNEKTHDCAPPFIFPVPKSHRSAGISVGNPKCLAASFPLIIYCRTAV
ncbi:hypothetical protein [Paraburkholderia sp. UYCP14C]|uniref:hypothetical protein n=1 Tax=Paraburkholderia sp. UYCP14C TaxID=2511130 RepID=UPI0035A00D33